MAEGRTPGRSQDSHNHLVRTNMNAENLIARGEGQPPAGNVACNHADCRHRLDNRGCGLIANGEMIMLNVQGQCEMRESKTGAEPYVPTMCQQPGCDRKEFVACCHCGMRLCAEHVFWDYKLNELDFLRRKEQETPGSVSQEERAACQKPYCHVDYINYVARNGPR